MRRTTRSGLWQIAGLRERKRLAFGSIGAAAVLVVVAALVGSTAAVASGTNCPSLNGRLTSSDVAVSRVDDGSGGATYSILTPSKSPSGGEPGLIEYCVFTSAPDTVTPSYAGWTGGTNGSGFSFQRPDGQPSNLPFDGSTVEVGKATWSGGVPAEQTILLHIDDPAECGVLYGGSPQTCWVFPGTPTETDPSATHVSTQILREVEGGGTPVGGDTHVAQGSTVHDTATVTADDQSAPQGSVEFLFFPNGDCSVETGNAAGSAEVGEGGLATPSSSEGPLGAGSYSFQAFFHSSDHGMWLDSTGPCEPLTVDSPEPPPTTTVVTTDNPPTTVITTNTPPPAAPPAPPAPPKSVDVAVLKSASPSSASLGGKITWTLLVRNNGPDTATGVKVADPLPAGVTFVSVGSTQGTCTGGAVVSCDLGTLTVGQAVAIQITTTATKTGRLDNSATVVANEPESNTANNSAAAAAVVRGAFTPPAQVCTAIAVSPKSIFVGRNAVLTLRVSQSGKAAAGIRVQLKGALGLVTKRTNKQGIVRANVKAKKAGIVSFAPVAQKKCTSPRIGVVGVFTPPVTG
jgi:uncharacterized repeat protein (TIGR01451 family)